ncbi:metal ABC transporter solute-binding protein, Zn/Mn family [Virgibacillus sp. W0181]|uniref:metal ABC transporter solute-binding protein, Zn/Mn family n=1 Tax=Virgibacillus sp. W0181 TaxID=3391581 RepID=UPI003F469F02
MFRKKALTIGCLFILLLVFSSCSPTNSNYKNDDQLMIYTSIYPIQYVAEQVAGDLAVVESIYPPGVDAHTYEPTSKEITGMANGDMFVYLGAGLEGFTNLAAEALESRDISFIELAEHETLFAAANNHEQANDRTDNEHAHDHGGMDPHIWLDPLRMVEMAAIIKDELIQILPDQEQTLEENFSKMKKEMFELDQQFKTTLNNKTNKKIIVAHAAYSYWEERYDIEQIAVSGRSSGEEPSQKELTTIAEQAKENNMKYVIFEQTGSDRVTQIIQQHIDAEALYIHNLEVLTEDDIDHNENYLTLMRKNLEVLDQATE